MTGSSPIRILTVDDHPLVAGAQGYLLKNTLHLELLQTIRAVHAGKRNLSPEVSFRSPNM